ncbi:MAG: SRPBCC family protein [Armatimonadetes bacterium]|nr:SRPBCC family protein [Armatimonadota bacterium]
MKTFSLKATLRLPMSVEDAWAYFSNPTNLLDLTPPSMRLTFSTPPPSEIRPGRLITYSVRPLLGIPVRWITEITSVEAPHRFQDRQRQGPFASWEHEHVFRPVAGGVEVVDDVRYVLPLGFVGALAQPFLVAPQLARLFAFRRTALIARFGAPL